MRGKYLFVIVGVAALTVAAIAGLSTNDRAASAADASLPRPAATPKAKTIREITYTYGEYDGESITKTDGEWKSFLTRGEFYILREDGTDRPYTGTLLHNKKSGTYHCAACGLALFSSAAKYESNTGWPSFYQPIFKKNVTEKSDRTLGEERTEIECSRCGGHLGHVFDDGPEPTGLRYCVNGTALKFRAAK